jgi:acetyl-CoA C-acetyltransferase
VTAGNSCGVSDGAAAVALVDAATHRRLGVPGLRVLATATAGVDPNRPGIGIVPAVQAALDHAGLGLDDLDVVELNEAFAGQVLACCDRLGLDPDRVCVEGGALALGHPWGASGAVLLVRLFSQLVRGDRGALGLAAIAVGGGQGVAMVVERCP